MACYKESVGENVLIAPSLHIIQINYSNTETCRVVFFFFFGVASNAWQLCDSTVEADYHDRFQQGWLHK